MSPGSSGRYQSRLLNFVHLQSRRLTQKWDHSFRHLQVATQWGVELLLYPLYRLLNPTAPPPKTLESKAAPPRLQLQPQTPPAVDTPIQEVLAAVKNLSSKSEPAPVNFWGFVRSKLLRHPPTPPSQSQPLATADNSPENIQRYLPVMRGIATNLVSRNLVLVTADNEILDILTPQQQVKLTARIIAEVGNYWHSWQLAYNQPQYKLLGKFNQILAQITGKIAVILPVLPESTSPDFPNTDKLISSLDASMAKWETSTLIPVQQRSQKIIQGLQTQLNIFVYGREQVATINNDLETHKLNIPALIAAAMNYFFGISKSQQIEQQDIQQQLHSRFPSLSDSEELQNQNIGRKSWLSFTDLFGSSQNVTNKSVVSSQQSKNKPQGKSTSLQKSQSRRHITAKKNESQGLTENPNSRQVDFQPDWIDVEATFVGYDKHPLEQMLQWLDRILLWIEQLIINVFYFFQGFWRGK